MFARVQTALYRGDGAAGWRLLDEQEPMLRRSYLTRVQILRIESRWLRARCALAMARVAAGEHDFFTKPIIDSFHTVWFELHEDLLTSLGLERSQEGG